jgi:hypothetical protein
MPNHLVELDELGGSLDHVSLEDDFGLGLSQMDE